MKRTQATVVKTKGEQSYAPPFLKDAIGYFDLDF